MTTGLTRPGAVTLLVAAAALAIGRVFGVFELFVLGAGLLVAVVLAVLDVSFRSPHLDVERWVRPPVLTVGEIGRVDLLVSNRSRWRSPGVELTEPVGSTRTARVRVGELAGEDRLVAGYRIPTARRGAVTIGPLAVERKDLLGLARWSELAAAPTEVIIAPQAEALPMPILGTGGLGRHLLAVSQRLGIGEFHSLRDYVPGDELRMIHWKASARSEDLKVRLHEFQGVQRCVVVLDRVAEHEAFERGVTIAASLVLSSDLAALTTRYVDAESDLRGPDVVHLTLQELAVVAAGPSLNSIERDPAEGLGLVIVVAAGPSSPAWQLTERLADPTLVRVGVFTDSEPSGPLQVGASTLERFRAEWYRLVGEATP